MSDQPADLVLPHDLAACQTLLIEQKQTIVGHVYQLEAQSQAIADLQAKAEQLEQEKQELQLAFDELLRRAFLKRSERYIHDPHQLRLDFGDTPEAADAAEGLAEAVEESGQVIKQHVRRTRKHRTEQLPEHLPRVEVEAPVPDEVKHCAEHGERKLIGYDRIEKLMFKRPKLWVQVMLYAKYACAAEAACGIASPERPTSLVEGDRYDTSIAAEVITDKYAYHLPTYRQQDKFAGSGWVPSRSTLLNLLTASAFVIHPLVEHFKRLVLASGRVGTDDTTLTLLLPQNIPPLDEHDPRSKRIHEVLSKAIEEGQPSVTARMWAYRGVIVPLNVFDFTVSRHRDGPDLFLKNFTGTIVADCYSGYSGITLRTDGAIARAACNAHARRKVFDARDNYPLEASVLLAKYQQLYDLEDRAKTMSADERLLLRQAEAVPVWASMREWLDSETAARVVPKSKLGQALGYLRNHWEPLQLYLTDGLLPIDNNDTEQLMKQVALGRKNWMFVGSVAAGARAADFLTLVSSAVRGRPRRVGVRERRARSTAGRFDRL
jgi:transposase